MKHAHPKLAQLAALADGVGRDASHALESMEELAAARRALELVHAAGLTGWVVPKLHGGEDAAGLAQPDCVSVRALCALREALAYHSGLLDVMFVMQGLGSYAISMAGQPQLQRELLTQVAQGRAIAALALTEPGAGSDLGSITTRAARVGAGWQMEGRKTFISNAPIADFFTLLARTGGEAGDGRRDGLTMFHVPARSSGLRVQRFEVSAPHPIGELHLDGVTVSDAWRLGAVGAGQELALDVLGRFRTSVAAAACGMARRALDESIRHLKGRVQFGKPLVANQALRFDLADMDARLRSSQLLVEEAAAAIDQGQPATAAVARAKLVSTESAWWICDRTVQHFGGLGVTKGNVAERLAREVRALRIYEGTSEIQKLILARELLAQ